MSRYYTNINQKPTVDIISSITDYYMSTGKTVVEYETAGWSKTLRSTSASNCYLWNYKLIKYADGTMEKTQPTIIWDAKTNGNANGLTTYYLATSKSDGVTTNTTGWKTSISKLSSYAPYLWRYQLFKKTDGSNYLISPHIYETYGVSGDEVILMAGGKIIPCPASLEYGLSDVSASESGRTEDTRMQKNRVGQKRTLSLQWNAKNWQETAFLMQSFDPEYLFIYYPDMKSGCYEVREFYTGDKKAPVKLWWVGTNKKLMEQVSFDVIER